MKRDFDYLIIGAGPAGLQLGYFLEKQGRDYLVLERAESPGAFFETFARHRMMISINKVHTGKDNPEANLRYDWNSLLNDEGEILFTDYSQRYFPAAEDLCHYLADFARHFDIQVKYNTQVTSVSKDGERFVLRAQDGERYTSKRLVVATGLFTPYIPDIPGVELCDTYADHSVDPGEYTNQRVLIVGKGNSAFETAENLIETAAVIHICSPESVRFAWQSHFVGHLRAVNNNFLDTYQLKSQNAVIDATIDRIEMQDGRYLVHIAYSHAMGQTAVIPYDRVILCTGFKFDSSIFDESCRPALAISGKFPAQTSAWESQNVPDLYFAGTLMQACDYKKTMSGFIHGFRYNVRALNNVLEQRYHGTPWPSTALEATPDALLEKIVERVNVGSGIFLQPGFLQDVLIVEDDGHAAYYEDIRRDYIADSSFSERPHYYTVSLEYGSFMGDPFSLERDPAPDQGHNAAYLHPVIRRFEGGTLVGEHHVNDDLESNWYKDIYVEPLRAFLDEQLAPSIKPAIA